MAQARDELTVWIGGAAGDGIASAGESFSKACTRAGYHVFAYNSYQSVIRGGHVCMHVRIGRQKVWTHGDTCNYLIALNQDTFKRYAKKVTPGGAVFYNTDKFKASASDVGPDVQLIGLPVMELVGNQLMQNTALMGAFLGAVGLDPTKMRELIQERFTKKGEAVIKANVDAFDKGIDFANTKAKPAGVRIGASDGKPRLLGSGNAIVGFGAVAAGCQFYAAYPMTPASSILHWLAQYGPKAGMLVKQAEDEIAVINMTVGAAHAGVRAMCGTSGGGFALMTEGIGEAGMTETPIVILEAQRGGPSTGLPTKTEQADLFQVLGASQGDFPKIVLAPCTLPECFTLTIRAFNLADRYQCPVIIMSDLYLAERNETLEGLEIRNIPIDRGPLLTQWNGAAYHRYEDTPTGVSPRAIPGTEGAVHVAATDEHDEDGILISDVFSNPPARVKIMSKRMRKIEHALKELPPPQLEGPADAELTLVGWGSTYSVLREAMDALNREGLSVNLLAPRVLAPFQGEAVGKLLAGTKITLAVEANYTGQLARLIRMETGFAIRHHLHKFDGEPFEPRQVIDHARTILKTKPKEPVIVIAVSDEGLPPDFSPIASPALGAETARQH